jgi:uncharacterized protein
MESAKTLQCRLLVVKIASRCNINCTYCYMYNKGDDSYKLQPKIMSEATVQALMQRVREHCETHGLKSFIFILHGGEPLLAGKDFIRFFTRTAHEMLAPVARPRFAIQTNGILLDEEWCQVLGECGVELGVSIDGPEHIHNMYRLDHSGKGSYAQTIRGLQTAVASTALTQKPGVLSVLNLAIDPLEWYHHIKSLQVSGCDLLLPDHHFDNPPEAYATSAIETPYADWLIPIYDAWFFEKEESMPIRIFQYLTGIILGNENSSDAMGAGRNELMVIETDGSMEALDVLKTCGPGFTKAGAHLLTHSIDDALQTDLANLFHLSHEKLSKQCLACPVSEVCGGGYIPHRYSSTNGFNNPSVYCKDLLKLIIHIQNRVFSEFSPEMLEELEVEKLDYSLVRELLTAGAAENEEPEYSAELESFRKT